MYPFFQEICSVFSRKKDTIEQSDDEEQETKVEVQDPNLNEK